MSDSSPIGRRVLLLALPALAQQYLFFVIQQYDQYLARHFTPDHQAALTTANYLYWFISSYSVVVSAGATALVGRLTGAGDYHLASRAAGQAILLAVGFGLLATVAAVFGRAALMQAVNLQGPAPAIAVEYLLPLALILAVQMVETGGIACLVGAGDTRTGLMVLAGVAAVNVPTAWVLSGGGGPALDYGFVGIALGTAISHTLGGVAVFVLLLRGRSRLKVSVADLVPDFTILKRLLRVSIPAGIDSLSIACCQLWFLSIVNRLGNAAAAAHGIAIRWEALGYLAGAAFGAAASAVVSQNLGARRPERASRGGWAAYAQGGGLMCVMGFLFFTLAEPMCRMYSPENDAVVALAVPSLRLIAFAMPGVAAWIIFTSALRAAGDTRVPVLFSWLGFLGVRIPLAFLLTSKEIDFGSWGTIPGYDLGLIGAWVAMVSDIYVRGVLFIWRYAGGRWKQVVV
jgi:putative MATE family efflux protein